MRYARINITKVLLITIAVIVLSACNKQENSFPNPSIGFINDSGFVFKDTTVLLNDTITLGIIARSESDQPLTHMNIGLLNDSILTSIDSGFYSSTITYTKEIVKGMADEEKWSFYVRDRAGRKSNTISILLNKDSNSVYGNINFLPEITFGAQNNNAFGSFLSLLSGQVFEQDDAYNLQSDINLLYYYDLIEEDENTIASPGANLDDSFFPGPTGLTNWSTRNTTRFELRENITESDFTLCQNDSLILYNTFEFASGKRKSKNLIAGNIFAFVTESGIKGLFLVHEVEDQEEGKIKISIKMQEI